MSGKLSKEAHAHAVAEIERDLGWSEADASGCSCNFREEPCERCFTLGWRIGGIGLEALEAKS